MLRNLISGVDTSLVFANFKSHRTERIFKKISTIPHVSSAVADLERVPVVRFNPPLEPNYFNFMGEICEKSGNVENEPPPDGFEPPF